MSLEEAFENGQDRVGRILALTERLDKIQSAINTIRYDQDLILQIPEVAKTLGAAKDAVTAELKTV
jgi:hypothetical protein